MKTVWRGFVMVGALLLGPLLLTPEPMRAAETVVSIHPLSVQTAPGQVLTVEVRAAQATDLAAFEFFLSFDPLVLRLVNIEAGDFLTSSGRQLVRLGPALEDDRVGFGAATYGREPGVNGSGVLARLTFQVVGAGTSLLRFQRLIITDTAANVLPVQGVGGQVISSGEAFQILLPLITRSSAR